MGLFSSCSCGRHGSQADHESEERMVEEALLRAVVRRDFFRSSAGAPRCRGVGRFSARRRQGSVRARRRQAREAEAQGRLHPDHLRHADHHGAPDGLLCQARPRRRGGEDRRLGGDPRQDAQQGIRRGAHALADAARHHARRRRDAGALHHAGGREHQRPGDHARDQAQGQARSEDLEGLQVRGAVRLLDAQLPAALLRRGARPRSGQRHPDPLGAAAGDGGQPARRQHRRLPRARSGEPARGVRRRRLHPHAVEGDLGRPPVLRLRRVARSSSPPCRTPTTRC